MSEREIIYGLSVTITFLAGYIAKMYRDNWKRSQEDKIRAEEKVEKDKQRDDILLREMIGALSESTIAVQNASKVMDQNMQALNIVNYRKL